MNYSILSTFDENYLPWFKVLLTSLIINNPNDCFDIYIMHSDIPDSKIDHLNRCIYKDKLRIIPIKVEESQFYRAKITDRYPKEMYYRLLAFQYLPEKLERVLYIDPDTLVINSIDKLWEINIDEHLFAAASHTGLTEAANNVNKIRLNTDTKYYNSGVLLINLNKCRERIHPEEIFEFVEKKLMS